MKADLVHQSETVLPHIGTIDFFDLQEQYKRSILQHYDKAHTDSELLEHAVEGAIKLIDALDLRDVLMSIKRKRGKSCGPQAEAQRCLTIAGRYGT
jgi:hypothetical protein